ncbi:DUF3618 domain-containing protein [Wenxinia marina]|uniref:Archaeal/vacuolar-type H+-ATPase subunit E n=1 Tax=Wenxinia marina DSM 24838 TaxID=1123501 RepID=A0A0D0P8Y2_9RHOB|nr:DUF3618 domain-containing protein [Wenxinia marina]KIQ68031.1 Archaeal/vacuolar-type H+-ATPase subunit E [Wenxinia marina DSM 24838]GGL75269.1 hypothetical protein GCM10011392_32390 [Wenxinia marina]
MADYRTPEEIERDVERERAGLSATLADIGNRLSFDGLAHQVSDQARYYASDFSATAQRVVRENPVGVALTGIGIAWLLFGDKARSKVSEMRHHDDPVDAGSRYGRSTYGGSSAYVSERSNPRSPYSATHMNRYGTRVTDPAYQPYASTAGEPAGWADERHWDDTDFELGPEDNDASPTFTDRIWSAVDRAKESASDLAHSLRAGVHDASDAVSDTNRRAQTGVRYRAQMTRDASRRMRDRLSAGTEHLSEEARNRVIAARERAVAARREAAVIARARGRDVADGFDAYPLAAGAIALAVGAAIGAMLPRTRFEDEYFGERSDALYHRAEEILREERARAEHIASEALDEAGKVIREKTSEAEHAASDAGSTIRDEAKDGVQRVADRAKAAAKDEEKGAPTNGAPGSPTTHHQ